MIQLVCSYDDSQFGCVLWSVLNELYYGHHNRYFWQSMPGSHLSLEQFINHNLGYNIKITYEHCSDHNIIYDRHYVMHIEEDDFIILKLKYGDTSSSI